MTPRRPLKLCGTGGPLPIEQQTPQLAAVTGVIGRRERALVRGKQHNAQRTMLTCGAP